jgi:CubicO group peptidase (beta-lactamase class C family)
MNTFSVNFRHHLMLSPCLCLLWLFTATQRSISQEPSNPPNQEVPAKTDDSWKTALDDVDSLLEGLISSDGPGVAIRVSRGDQVLLERGYGLADLSHHSPVTADTKFRIGSVTKNFTAAAILKLQEEGKLNVTDSLESVLPDFPNGDKVTIAQLLNHTSGIPSYTNDPDFFATVQLEVEPDALIESFKHKPLDFDPGTKFAYNNSGYFLLGEIVAKLSGMPFDRYLEQQFFQPLGMKNSGTHHSTAILRNEAYGYSFAGAGYEKALDWDMSRAGGAGALYSTVGDLDIWVRALTSGKVLKRDSLDAAFKSNVLPQDDVDTHYGFGWFIDSLRGLDRISHGGGLQGFSSHLAFFPDHDLCIVVLHNALPSAPAINPAQFSDRIAVAVLEDQMQAIPEYAIDESVDAKLMEKYVGRYDYKSAMMEISLEDGQLYSHITGQPRHPIYPASPTKFFWKVVDAQVEFLLDENGTVQAVKHTQGASEFRAERLPDIEPQKLATEVLQRHVGEYKLGGLGTLVIAREDDGLTAKLAAQPALQIFAKNEREFFYTIVPAEIIFDDLQEGKSQKITLKQGGLAFEGQRSK